MIAKCLGSGWCEMAYEDDEAIFLKIRDAKGEPPNDAVDDAPPTPEEQKQLDEEEKTANAMNANQNVDEEDDEN